MESSKQCQPCNISITSLINFTLTFNKDYNDVNLVISFERQDDS